MESEPSMNTFSGSHATSPRLASERESFRISGWAEMWAGITCGLVFFGCYSLGKLLWPINEVARLVFTGVGALLWILGCRNSGLIARRYDFPDGKYANLKRFVAGGIGFFALFSPTFLWDAWDERLHVSLGSSLASALFFLVGGIANLGRNRGDVPR